MIEIKGNLWDFYGKTRNVDGEPSHIYVICITTNGSVRTDGCAVLGRGCAREAAKKLRDLPRRLGELLQQRGNIVLRPYGNDDAYPEDMILTFPVKHVWNRLADRLLIRESAYALAKRARGSDYIFILPRPGCGNGGLHWVHDVKPIIAPILPDNVLVISKPGEK